jgi:hypothetical protein
MDGTIRDYIKRRVRMFVGAGILGWLIAASTLAFGQAARWSPMFGGLVLFGAALALQFFVRCPKCKVRIGQTIAFPVGLTFGSRGKVNFCPYCGVNLDTPCKQPTSPIS